MRSALLALSLCLSASPAYAWCERAVTTDTVQAASMDPLAMLRYLRDASADSWDEQTLDGVDFHAVVSLGQGRYIVDVTVDGVRSDVALTIKGRVTEAKLFDAFDKAFVNL